MPRVGPEPGIGSQHTAVAMTMYARRWNELGDGLKEFEGRKQQLGAAVDVRLGQVVTVGAQAMRGPPLDYC